MKEDKPRGIHKLEFSAILTLVGVGILFLSSILVTLIAPSFIDPSWKQSSSSYQTQMYQVLDPNVFVSTANPGKAGLQYVYHLQEGITLLSFEESALVKFVAPSNLDRFITHYGDSKKILTSKVLLLRKPQDSEIFKAKQVAEKLQKTLQQGFQGEIKPYFEIYELYDPQKNEAFAITQTDGITSDWAEKDFAIIEQEPLSYDTKEGVVYIKNPREYRQKKNQYLGVYYGVYDENGEVIKDIQELREGGAAFLSRAELIHMGEDIYRIEGCWYCHTDQTRTLIQDVVLNGSASFPAPPSSASEYVFQRVSFPGTRRIGPDLSRVGIKRPDRDWHMSHFWFPQSKSQGSVMPSFAHFFDKDPSGTLSKGYGVPNYKFEALFQYLMTKGTRITPPTQAWWLGKDPIQTLDILDGKK